MFYAHFVLSKKGPLARIWLAAHWDKKLTKAHVFETNIEGSVEAIIQPKVKLALRTSGHLLLGVVRIYSRKAKYLLADCNEAFVKIKMAFRPGVVDLPEENREAAVSAITMPETFHDFDTAMADLNDLDVQAQFAVNQSRPEEITMREDLGNITLVGDDGFGDMGFEAGANIIQDAHMDDTLYVRNEAAGNLLLDTSGDKNQADKAMDIDLQPQPRDDGFGDGIPDFEGPAGCDDDDDSDNGGDFGGVVDDDFFGDTFVGEGGGLFEEPPVPEVPQESQLKDTTVKDHLGAPEDEQGTTVLPEQTTVVPDQTTLIPNEAEAFALEPIDVTTIGTERKAKRKRKLVIDDQKGIPSETMKLQLSDTSDITTTLDLAPPTKKLKYWKETGGVEKLFALPGRPMVSKRVGRMFNRNLVTRPMMHGEDDRLDLNQPQEEPEMPPPVLEPVQPDLSHLQPELSHLQPELSHLQPELSHLQPELSHLHPELSRLHESAQELRRDEQSISALEMPSMNIPEPERPSMAESSLMEPQALDSHLAAPEPDQPSMSAESFILQQSVAGLDSLVEPHTPLTRSRLQQQQQHDDDDDVEDIFGQDLPPVELEQEDQEENGQDAEDLEEKRWSRRTQQMMHVINKHLKTGPTASFKELTARNNRKQVASKFYTLLVLKKMQAIEVEQSLPYGDIAIVQGPKMGLVF